MLTEEILNRTSLTVRAGNDTVVAPPALFNAPTGTELPSENTNAPAFTRSSVFGRSYNTTRSTDTGEDHTNRIHDPALPPTVAHSRDESAGYPDGTPSTALSAVCPVDVFCDDADTVTPDTRARFILDDGSDTDTDTSSVADNTPSDTVNRNVCTPAPVGVNVGRATDVPLSTTPGPDVCTHAYDTAVPSGSDDPDPSNVTNAPLTTD